MNSNMVEGEVKRTMMMVSRQVHVVADHSKFEQTAFNAFAGWERVDHVITTKQVNEQVIADFAARKQPQLILV